MNKIIALLIVAGVAFGAWKFWPDIMAKVNPKEEDEQKTEQPAPADANPAPTPNTPPIVDNSQGPSDPGLPPLGQNPSTPMPPVVDPDPQPPVAPSGKPVDVSKLAMQVSPNMDRLQYLVTSVNDLGIATFQQRTIIGDTNPLWTGTFNGPGKNQFNFTSGRPTGVEITVEIMLDPELQLPAVQQVIGSRGENLVGPLVVDLGQKKVIHAKATFRPDTLKFSSRRPVIKLKLVAANAPAE